MSVRHAVLGLVIERPGYGYQLAQRLEERCGSWRWERSGVYGTLDRLEEDGHIAAVRVKEGSRSSRRAPSVIYDATARGREFFAEWMFSPSPPSPFRQELDLKMLLAGPEFLPGLIESTWAQEQQCADALQSLVDQVPAAAGACVPATWSEAAVILQRRGEIELLQARIKWLQDARGVMKRMLDRSGLPRR